MISFLSSNDVQVIRFLFRATSPEFVMKYCLSSSMDTSCKQPYTTCDQNFLYCFTTGTIPQTIYTGEEHSFL